MSVWLYQAGFIARRLASNHRPGEEDLLPRFGPGTDMTMLRGWFLACLAGILFIPRPSGLLAWAPAAIYMLADLADYLDGYLARISDHATLLGEALDIEFDALGLLIAVSVAIHYAALPAWYLPVGLARYAFVFGLWARRRAGEPIHPLPQSDSRRPLAGLQMGALSVILIPALHPPVTTLGGVLLAVPLLAGFTRDWLVVSGAIDPASPAYQRIRESLKKVLLRWAPIPLRAIAVTTVVLLGSVQATTSERATSGATGLPIVDGSSLPLRLIELAAATAVAVGFVPRVSAIVLLATLLVRGIAGVPSVALLAALTATVVVLMIGSGALSIWQPEIGWFRHRAGEKRPVE
jgi:CDP-diacylglycerol--glycerol-3-phosphate 3-phosphatidyltransferase